MNAIPTWVFTALTIVLIGSTIIVAVRTSGGIKKPVQLLTLTIVTIAYVFSLPFIQGVTPQLGLDLQGGVSVVLSAKGKFDNSSLNVAVGIIRDRVDALGVAEPEISRQGSNIVVDLPGEKDSKRAIELVGETAALRFREVAATLGSSVAQGTPEQQAVLQQVYANEQGKKATKTSTTKPKSTTTTSAKVTTTTEATGSAGKSKHFAASTTTTTAATTTTTAKPVTPAVPTSITLSCGGTAAKNVTLTGDLTKPTSRENDIAKNAMISLDDDGIPSILCPAVLEGDIVSDAFRQVDATGEISVGVKLTGKGGTAFTNLIGKPLSGKSVAIVLDSKVVSAPTIQPDLANGLTNNQLQITVGSGKSQSSEVSNLVTKLKYGKLPVTLERQTAQKVSPTLGSDQLHAGLLAGALGLLLVIIYMILYYRVLALVVITGVGLSGLTTYALICWLGEVRGLSLTLAGAVGLIVSLGVTVDSYIVYFEKLKDEVRQGRTLRSCLDTGFKAAFKTILAADLVSLMGAGALFYLASGSVRGFAFFLGMSTLLDLLISLCFMHPMVKLLAQKKSLITSRWFGIAAALDKKDLSA